MSQIIINSILNKINEENSEEIKRNIKLLYAFRDYIMNHDFILITNEDIVYCYGENDCGVLGFGHSNYVNKFTINEELSNKSIIDLKSSFHHTVARHSNAKLYCWGINRYLGNGIEDHNISKPQLNQYLTNENIIDMCCGDSHTLVFTSNNEVYAWGNNIYGQIGNISHDNNVITPFKLNYFNEEKVKAISCGSYHSMTLTESGSVFSWGHNGFGQLGHNSENEIEKNPKSVQIEVIIEKISCGCDHSLLLSREGDIYVFGSNEYKQLGIQTNGEKQMTPIKINHSEKFIDIASSHLCLFSAALSENGLYYVWGEYCEEVEDDEEGIIPEPKETKFKSFNEIFFRSFEETYEIVSNYRYYSEFNHLELIAFGSFGIVCKAKNRRSDEIFAIKMVPINNQLKEKALKEIEILSKLKSERIVNLEAFWIENNYHLKSKALKQKLSPSHEIFKPKNTLLLHIQMEFCYKTLKQIIEILNKELNQKESEVMTPLGYYISSELFIEILESVEYLHKNNIIHRDLKPSNILISNGKFGRFVRISDFGLATIHDFDGQSHTKYTGTRKYMAPEVLKSRIYDTKADIYSLAIITPKIFNIDINEPIGKESCLETQYKNLFDLIIKMSALQKNKRPDCQQILREKNSWALTSTQFIKNNLKMIETIKPIEESFHMFFIQTKLKFN